MYIQQHLDCVRQCLALIVAPPSTHTDFTVNLFTKKLFCGVAVCSVVACCGLAPSIAHADDWPQWRGLNRDAVLSDAEQVAELPSGKLTRKWSTPIGSGYSGPTVANGCVYVSDLADTESTSEVERVRCFDAKTGDEIWSHQYDAPYTISYRAGPRAAVTLHDDVAISVGAMGHMFCFNAADGKILWKRDLGADYVSKMPNWGISASPLIYDDVVIQIAAGDKHKNACVVGLELATGKERWRALSEHAAYSSPILVRQGDQDVAVCWTGESVTGLDPTSGKVLWSVPMPPSRMPIGVPTPVVAGDKLFVSSFYDGSMLIQLGLDQAIAKQVWHRVGTDEKNTDALHCMIGNPVIRGNHVYGGDSFGELRCLDLETGDRVWENLSVVKRNRWATIHIIKNGDRELILNEQGELISATFSPAGYEEHSRAKLIAPTKVQLSRRDGVVWAFPAIANGHIFIRSDKELVCAEL